MRQLGQYLRDMGALSDDELQSALLQQQQSGALLGDILRERELVRPAALEVALALQRQHQAQSLTLLGAVQRIFALVRRCRLGSGLPLTCIAAGVLAGALSFPIVFYFYSRWAWDMIGISGNLGAILIIGGGTLLLTAVAVGLEAFATYVCIQVTGILLQDVAAGLHDNLVSRTLARAEGDAAEAAISIYAQNLEQFATNIESFLIKFPKAVTSLLVFAVILLISNVGIALLVLALAPAALLLPPIVSSRSQPYLHREVALLGQTMSRIEPFFRYFRTTGGVLLRRATQQLPGLLEEHHMNQACKWFFWNSSFNVRSLFNLLTLAAILIYGGWCVLQGSLSLAMLFSLYLAVSMILPRFNDLYECYFHLTAAGYNAASIEEQMRVATVQQVEGRLVAAPEGDVIQRVQVRVAQFAHQGRTVLADFAAELLPGRLYLLVGPSGSGKSTLARLLAGILVAEGAQVLIEYGEAPSPSQVLGHVAYVGQEHAFLEHLDLVGNIACQAQPDAEQRQRIEAGVRQLQVALDGRVERDAVSLNQQFSGGEKQRLHLLQGLLAPQKIRVFDEPTASLDAISAELVKQVLASVPADEVRVVISHDLNWPVAAADIITLPLLSPT